MYKLALFGMILFSLSFSETRAQEQPKAYGTHFENAGTGFSPGRLPALMGNAESKAIQLTGKIKEVCQTEGCWIVLEGGGVELLVKMKDHAFTLPKDLAGKMALVNGVVTRKTQSIEEQKHYLEDAGADAARLAEIKEPKQVFEMEATGVLVYD